MLNAGADESRQPRGKTKTLKESLKRYELDPNIFLQSPGQRRRIFFAKFCWRSWARVLVRSFRMAPYLPHSFATKRLQKAKEEKELSNHHQLLIFFALNPGLHRELGKKIVLFCSAE